MDNIPNTPISSEAWDYIKTLCLSGKKMAAVKFYKTKTGATLQESKKQVEYYCLKAGFKAKNKYPKGLIITICIVVFISIVIAVATSDKPGEKSSNTNTVVTSDKKWTEILHFTGNGMKKSQTIHLSGSESKIVYSYSGHTGVGTGIFSVYVMKAGTQLMKDGGFPEVMTDNESDQGESSFQKDAGEYYIAVNAVGTWTLSIQELR